MSETMLKRAEGYFLHVFNKLQYHETLPELQSDLKVRINEIGNAVQSGQLDVRANEWESIQRALVYWTDEVMTDRVADWQNYKLEQAILHEGNRAWKFYTEAKAVIDSGQATAPEIFYLASVLGFRGDIIDAYQNELRIPLPGNASTENDGIRHWRNDLARRVRFSEVSIPQGEKLEGSPEPLPHSGLLKGGFASLLISAIITLVIVGWWLT